MTELKIIKKIQAGNVDEFVLLYEMYIKKIYNFVFYKIGNKNDAEDLTSTVFIKTFENINKFDVNLGKSFSSRIYRIANNVVVDFFRENSSKPTYQLLNDIAHKTDLIGDLENKQKLQEVINYLDTLDVSKKDIFIMRVWDNLSYEEISEITGKSISNCKTIFSRTMKDVVTKFGVVGLLLFIGLYNFIYKI